MGLRLGQVITTSSCDQPHLRPAPAAGALRVRAQIFFRIAQHTLRRRRLHKTEVAASSRQQVAFLAQEVHPQGICLCFTLTLTVTISISIITTYCY